MNKNKLYQLADFFVHDEKGAGGLSIQKDLRARLTGEFRAPKEDEWYLSGAIPRAYHAKNDLTTSFYIVKIVKIVTESKERIVKEF